MSQTGSPANMDDLYSALRAADAAHDTDGAARLTQYILAQQNGQAPPAVTPQQAPQNNSWSRLPEMAGSALVKGTAALAGVPGDLQSLAESGENWLSGGRLQPLLDKLPVLLKRLPTSSEIMGVTDKLGLTNRNELTPTTPLERYGTAGIEAVPAVAATVASGGLDALPAVATGISSALASQGAHDLAPDSPWAPVVAGLVTGLGVGGVTGQVENVLNARAVNKAVDTTAAGVTAAEVARDKAASELESAKDAAFQGRNDLSTNVANVKSASRADFAATREQLATARDENHAQQDQAVAGVADGLGKSTTLQDAGSALQSHARNWLTNVLPDKLEAAWAPVAAAIPKTMTMGLGQFSSALDSITKSAGELEPLAALLKPSLPAKLAAKLQNKTDLADLTEEGPTSAAQGEYSWQDVSKLRSALGDAMSNPKTVADIGAKNMSRLYASLTTDMRVGADKAGAVGAFDEANAESQRLYQLAEGPMARVVSGPLASAEDQAPETVAKSLLSSAKSGATDLAALRAEIPQGVNELAAAHLRLDPKSFARLPPESLGALVPNSDSAATVLGAQAAKEQATAAASQGIKLAQQTHQANVELAQQAAKEGNFANASAVRSSGKALREAREAHGAAQQANAEAIAKQKALPGNSLLDHSGTTISGLLLGEELGRSMDPYLFKGAGLGNAAGALAGAVAPKVVRGAVNLLKPRGAADLAYPLLGGAVGANALYGRPQ